jgi:hypothetical protein
LPIVSPSHLASSTGPSAANEVEQIAAEVVSCYLPEHDSLEPRALFVEHDPDHGCRRDALVTEGFGQVPFAHRAVRPRWSIQQRGMVQYFGEPDWRRMGRAEVESWIGKPLPQPACTCPVAHR